MNRFTIVIASTALLLLCAIAPLSAAETGDQPAPAAAAQSGEAVAPPQEDAPGCAANGECCGSAACGEAKRRSMAEGKAAMADCPCRRKQQKPEHTH